jgi:hypothetical protein
LVDVDIDGKILKWLIKKWDGGGEMDWMGPAQVRDMYRTCECDNEPPGFVKCGVFPD